MPTMSTASFLFSCSTNNLNTELKKGLTTDTKENLKISKTSFKFSLFLA